MNSLFKKSQNLRRKLGRYSLSGYLFVSTLIFLAMMCVVPNNKILGLMFLGLIFVYWLRTNKLHLSVLLVSVVSMVFHSGKTYIFQLIERNMLPYSVRAIYEQGYNLHLIITVYDVLVGVMLYLIIRKIVKNKGVDVLNRRVLLSFFFYLVYSAMSSFFSSNFSLSLMSISLSLLPHFILLVFWSINFSKIKLSRYILPVIMALLLFQSALGLLQFLKHDHLGLTIEPNKTIELFGAGVDENVFSFRPTSTFEHTNVYAIYLTVMILLLVSMPYLRSVRFSEIATVAISFGVLALLTTLGRSAWLSFGLSLLGLLYLIERVLWRTLQISQSFIKRFFYILVVGGVLTSVSWIPRLQKMVYIFEASSGMNTRLHQFSEAIDLIVESPLIGTGAEQSVIKNLTVNPSGVSSYFVSVVHNAYLLTAVETGIPSLVFVLMLFFFISKLFVQSYQRCTRKNDKIVVLAAMVAFSACLFNGLFQPMFQFRLLVLSILIGYIPNEKSKKDS